MITWDKLNEAEKTEIEYRMSLYAAYEYTVEKYEKEYTVGFFASRPDGKWVDVFFDFACTPPKLVGFKSQPH